MRKFTDKTGREWSLQLGLATARHIARATDGRVDFVEQSRGTGHNLFSELASDLELLGQVLFLLVEPQCVELGISELEFADGFDMDALERAQTALIEAVIDFFPSRSRGLLLEAKAVAERVAEDETAGTLEKARELLHSQEMRNVMVAAIRGK
jgi:hypothetical protein